MVMPASGVGFVGVRTERFDEMVHFCTHAMQFGAPLVLDEQQQFAVFAMADGARFELFGPACAAGAHLGSAPLVGFVVPDVAEARVELETRGGRVVSIGTDGPVGWMHFVAPDGNLYELMHDHTEHSIP